MVDRTIIAPVGVVAPQQPCIDGQDHPSAAAQQIGQAAFVVARHHIIANTVAVQKVALVIHTGATQQVGRQAGVVDSPVVADRQADHLALGGGPPGLRKQVGNRRKGAGARVAHHSIALHVVQFVALGVAVHQHLLAIHQALLWLGEVQQHQVLHL